MIDAFRSASAEQVQPDEGTGFSAGAAACTPHGVPAAWFSKQLCDRWHPDAVTFVLPGNHRTRDGPLRGTGHSRPRNV